MVVHRMLLVLVLLPRAPAARRCPSRRASHSAVPPTCSVAPARHHRAVTFRRPRRRAVDVPTLHPAHVLIERPGLDRVGRQLRPFISSPLIGESNSDAMRRAA